MEYSGSCHCDALTFTVSGDIETANECNCSICSKKGYLLAFMPFETFKLTSSDQTLKTYTFHTHNVQHQFCGKCGCAPFGHGTAPDGSKMVAINLRCLKNIDLDTITIEAIDGASY